ncbi:unnamed protein product [Linum tenue]|uniref:DNA-directed DNA polymerase n=1 Tax=Linum tenue TaxID=586396 RepID=A0AAV0KCC0_9ROSI|nr:unnamed protein product [Linum tenue]
MNYSFLINYHYIFLSSPSPRFSQAALSIPSLRSRSLQISLPCRFLTARGSCLRVDLASIYPLMVISAAEMLVCDFYPTRTQICSKDLEQQGLCRSGQFVACDGDGDGDGIPGVSVGGSRSSRWFEVRSVVAGGAGEERRLVCVVG